MATTEEQVRRKARVLAGFMNPQEAQGFAVSFVLDQPAFLAEFGTRAAARATLPPGYTAPTIADIPPAADPHVAQLRANPDFAAAYPNAELKMVELGKLIAWQSWMDTDVSHNVHGTGNVAAPTFDEIFRKCLPIDLMDTPQTLWRAHRSADGAALTIYSHNNTLNFKMGWDESTGEVQLLVQPNPNLMLVYEHAQRYMLMNGYHRAFWLRSRGVDMVPAAIQRIGNAAQFNQPGFVQAAILLGPRPPLIDDYLDDKLALTCDVRAMLRMVRISAESSLVPRLL